MKEFEDLELDEMIAEVMKETMGEEDDTTTNDIDEEQSVDTTDIEDTEEDDRGSEEEAGDIDDEEDNSDELEVEEEEETPENTSDFSPVEVNFQGTPITLQSKEELQKYLDRTSRMGAVSDIHQAADQAGLTMEDFQLLMDAKNGDKKAIAKLIVDGKVDTEQFDLADADTYEAQWKPTIVSEEDRIAQEIARDPELKEKVQNTFTQVPEDFAQMVVANAAALSDFKDHVQSGLADKIIPEAKKRMILDGMDFATAYTTVGGELIENGYKPTTKPKRKISAKAEQMKKKATRRKSSNQKKGEVDAEDVWNMSDEDFAKEFGVS